jgi:hypothetical protein
MVKRNGLLSQIARPPRSPLSIFFRRAITLFDRLHRSSIAEALDKDRRTIIKRFDAAAGRKGA